jgi:ATP-dependent Lhr-like helicase
MGREVRAPMRAQSEGRWSLRASRWAAPPSETERRAAQARALLERYGVVTREAAQAEIMCEGFASTYAVLKAMEESGRVRRGYFVAGRGATQFALPGADDRLRAVREPGLATTMHVLCATDPANPYGAALPWPAAIERAAEDDATRTARPQRAAGARVLLCDGALAGWLGRNGQALLTFLPADEPMRGRVAAALAEALAALADEPPRRVLLLTSIDGALGPSPALAAALAKAGFTPGDKGWMRRGQVPSSQGRVPTTATAPGRPSLRDRLAQRRAGRG